MTRRAVVRGAAWAAPVALATVAAPAASRPPEQHEMDLGIFVSASASADTVGRVGYFGGNAGGVQTTADTPEESFRSGTTWAESDLNWVDGRGTTATTWNAMNAVNGEGSFTPAISPISAAKAFTYTDGISGSPKYVSPLSAKGSTTFNAPTVTTSSKGQVVVTMSYTFTTNQAITAGTAKPYAQIISPHTFGLSKPGLLGFQIAADITGTLTPSTTRQPLQLSRALTQRTYLSLSGAWPPGLAQRL